jgi:pumilio homology domain family member 6
MAERKASKPLAEQLARTKKIWERLRRKSHVTLEERKALIAELFEIITGKMKDYVLKHDSVRVVQTAVRYANLDQRKAIAKELMGSYRQLAESRYAKFLIGKLLVRGDSEIRDLIVPEFFGYVRRLIKHPEASWILDDVYRGIATKKQKATILREWYGPEFAIFQNDGMDDISGDLADVLAKDARKRAPIMRSLHELINHLIQKKMTGFTLLHDAMLQYFLNAKPGIELVTDFIELIKGDEDGDLLKNLAFTKSGSRVVCLALAYGTAKDRRQILKSYKDTIQLMACDSNAHIVLLTAYDVIDDTVLTAKSIFSELLGKDTEKQSENIIHLANNMIGRTTLLYLFQGRSSSLFPSSLSAEISFLSEIDDIRATTSKKDPNTRQKELAKVLYPPLIRAIVLSSADLVTTSFGCQFITAVLFGAEGDKSEALKAVASTAAGDPTIHAVEIANTNLHIAYSSSGGKMLKALVIGGPYDRNLKKIVPISPPLNFADILYPVIKNHLVEWAIGPSSYLVLSLFEAENFSFKEEAIELLSREWKKLVKASKGDMSEQKARAEAAVGYNDVKAMEKNGKTAVLKDGETGNRGAKLILELLN